nr:hypothetical protein [Tanacetum cinerariifolium]
MSSMGSQLIVKGDDCFDGLVRAEGGVVSGGGVVFGVVSSSDGEEVRGGKGVISEDSMGVDGGATLSHIARNSWMWIHHHMEGSYYPIPCSIISTKKVSQSLQWAVENVYRYEIYAPEGIWVAETLDECYLHRVTNQTRARPPRLRLVGGRIVGRIVVEKQWLGLVVVVVEKNGYIAFTF